MHVKQISKVQRQGKEKTSKMFTHTHEFAHKTVHPTSYRFPNRTKTERPIRDKYRDHAKRADWDEVYR